MEICPLAKSGEELILNLINSENNTEITAEQLVLGTPAANSEGGNTALNVAAAEDAPWNKFVDVSYDRLDMATIFHNERAEISLPKGATPSDLVCHLNYTYGTAFKVDEFDIKPLEDGELPELYEMTAKAENLAYTGTLQVFADLDRMPLAARLTVTDLNGFGYSAGGDVVLSHDKTMPASWTLGYVPNANRNGFEIAENVEMFMGGRSTWASASNNTSIFQAAEYAASARTPFYSAFSTGALYNNTIYRYAPFMSLFMGLKPGKDKFEHLLDGYDIVAEMTVSALNGGNGLVRTGPVVRNGDNLRIEFDDGQRIALTMAMQDGVAGYQAVMGIPYTPTGMFANLTAATMTIPGTTQRPACCTGLVTFKFTATRKAGLAKPIEMFYRTAFYAQ